jgi:predicted ATP-dependent endonuclease of OLD family
MSETSTENQTERLIVKNFGPLKDVDIELKDIMVFIGPQASGKSTLAKILYLILYNYSEVAINKLFNDINIDFFNPNTSIKLLKNDETIFLYDKNNFINKGLIFSQKENRLQNTPMELSEVELDNLLEAIKTMNKKQSSASLLKIPKIKNTLSKLRFSDFVKLVEYVQTLSQILAPSQCYIPAERNIVSSLSDFTMGVFSEGISISRLILNFGKKFEIARKELKKTYINFLDITYEHNFESGNRVSISSGQSISLSEAASGLQSVIPLYLVTKHFAESDLLVIEEPELNLFPEAQKKLVEFIIETCRDKTKRLIITTHSPYILTVLNNLIQAHNVVKERPELEEEVNKIIPKERWLDFDKVGVYYVADGTAKNIMHEKNRIIKAENLDSVSKNLSNEFGQLLDLQYGD